jgi:hypothetical protein
MAALSQSDRLDEAHPFPSLIGDGHPEPFEFGAQRLKQRARLGLLLRLDPLRSHGAASGSLHSQASPGAATQGGPLGEPRPMRRHA